MVDNLIIDRIKNKGALVAQVRANNVLKDAVIHVVLGT